MKKCKYCNEDITPENDLTGRKKYCSGLCRDRYFRAHRENPESTCEVCGKPFLGRQQTCGPSCALKLSNSKRFYERQVTCEECGETFTARHARAKICSVACAHRRTERVWRTKQPKRECEWCGNLYFPRNPNDKSCSKLCAYKNQMKGSLKSYTCSICGAPFTSHFCRGPEVVRTCSNDACKDKAFNYRRYRSGFREECERVWGPKACILCGRTDLVQAHHISGDPSDKADVVWLCKKHHNAVHYEFITKNPKTPQDYQDGLITMWYLLFKGELD